jgi:hypothetical protein
VDSANEVASFIEKIGIPLATALGLGGMLWWLVKYVLGSIVDKITEAQAQTEADIKELRQILISLIDKNQLLANDLIRLDTMLRVVLLELPPDEKRIGRNPDNKVK